MSARATSAQSTMIGDSEPFRRLDRDLAQVAPSDATVLITGESGSGKNLAARVLHERSGRAAGPRVEVHLAALAPTLVEAELFGHEAGAFTGAHGARRGRFELADGGTLVLDGVESLPLAIQPKLLRVLQEREVEPLGAEAPRPIDVRIVALSSANLAERAREGRFREDLYYRLAVVGIEVPPLRARLDDLAALGAALLARGARRHRVPPRKLSEGALARLAAHAWPGNLRELENALERVLLLPPVAAAAGAPIAAEEFAFLAEAVEGVPGRLAREALAHGIPLPELERAVCELALREAHGNVAAAARAVGLSRRAFDHRLGREPAPEA